MDHRDGDTLEPAPDTAGAARPARSRSVSQQLLEESPFEVSRRFSRREGAAELAVAGCFAVAALSMALLVPWERPLSPELAVALVLGYAAAARVAFNAGAGVAVPTELVLVPMLFVLPAPAVPLLVSAAFALSSLPDVLARRAPAQRIVSAVADAWHALGPALVLGLGGGLDPEWADWPLFVAALAAQFAADLLSSATREWLGRGIAPTLQLRVLGWVWLVDAVLAPIGLLSASAAADAPYAALLVLPLIALLAIFARDRSERIRHALDLGRANEEAAVALSERLEDLNRERARVELAIMRIGKAFSSSLDRAGLLEIVMHTAADALSADCGRILAASEHGQPLTQGIEQQACVGNFRGLETAIKAAEAELLAGARAAEVRVGEAHAVVCALEIPGTDIGTTVGLISLARRRSPFAAAETDLLHYLAAQAAASIDNLALHELVRRQAVTDGLTGLSNHRRLQDALASEVERSTVCGEPLALIMLDVDDFKQINDAHGHHTGDLVLAALARALRATCRAGDEPARYGGEEFAVVLPNTDLTVAEAVAEAIRRAIERIAFPLPSGDMLELTASVGVAALDSAHPDKASLIAAADAALYQAKHGGKNRTARAAGATRGAPACIPQSPLATRAGGAASSGTAIPS